MEQEIPTYYPGDRMVLEVEITHRLNFRRVEAVFIGRPAEEGAMTVRASMSMSHLSVRETKNDGTKTSVMIFEEEASGNRWVSGPVYELAELRAETVGVLPGESKYGSTISLDVGGIADVPRFRFEDELGAGQVEFRSARLR